MAAGKTKSIDEIDDIVEMFKAMAALDNSSKGLMQTLQDMKDRVKTVLIEQSSKSPSWNAGLVRMLFLISVCHLRVVLFDTSEIFGIIRLHCS